MHSKIGGVKNKNTPDGQSDMTADFIIPTAIFNKYAYYCLTSDRITS